MNSENNSQEKIFQIGTPIIPFRKNNILFDKTLLYFIILQIYLELVVSVVFKFDFSFTKFLFIFIFSLFFAGSVRLITKKNWYVTCVIIISFLVMCIYFGNMVYFSNFQKFSFWTQLTKGGEALNLGINLTGFIKKEYLVCFLPLPVLLFVLFKNRSIEYSKTNKISKKAVFYLFLSVCLLIGSNLVIFNYFNYTNKLFVNRTVEYEKKYGILDMSMMGLLTRFYSFEEKQSENIDIIKNTFTYQQNINSMTGIFKGKNLIFIEGESIASYGIDPILTPTLYKLQTEGMNFTNYYSPRLNTFESEYAILNSFYLTPEKETISFNTLNSMPSIFKKEKYDTKQFHDYDKNYYLRADRALELGFNDFYGLQDLNLNFDPNNFPDDLDLFMNANEFIDYDEQSFFHHYITVSAHGSYDINIRDQLLDNYKTVEQYYPNYPSELKTYLASVMQTDSGIEYLLKELEQTGEIDNTVIMFVGDHYPYALEEQTITSVTEFSSSLDVYKVPFIIWSKELQSTTNDIIMSNIDILPTVANLFNLDLSYAMGSDVFSKNAKDNIIVEWYDNRAYSILTNYGGYDGLTDIIIGNITDEQLSYYFDLSYNREKYNNSLGLKELVLEEEKRVPNQLFE